MKKRTRRRVHRAAVPAAGALALYAYTGTWGAPAAVAIVLLLAWVAWKIHRHTHRKPARRTIPGPRIPLDAQTTTLYRWWGHGHRPWWKVWQDRTQVLLYVGIANRADRRFSEHEDAKPWVKDAHTVTLQHYPNRRAALSAEEHAIKTEKPLYNKVHSRTNSRCAPIR